MTPDIRQLLGGYATGTLTAAERARLFAAALEDQALFDALAEEQPVKDLLDDPESRGYLLAELDRLNDAAIQPEAPRMMAKSAPAPARMRSFAAQPDAMPPSAASGGAVRVQPPPPAKPPARFWLPFVAVMMALLVTGWFWWRHQPDAALQQVALSQAPSAGMPGADTMASEAQKRPPATRASQSSSAAPPAQAEPMQPKPDAPVPAAPAGVVSSPVVAETRTPAPPPPLAERQADAEAKSKVAEESARAGNATVADKAVKKEQSEVDFAPPQLGGAAPAKQLAPGVAANAAPLPYRLLRLENGQFVSTPTNTRFKAGDTVVILLPSQPTPRLSTADGARIALEREANGYRSARIELSAGPRDFIVTPALGLARSRAARDAEAKTSEILRIRLSVE